MSLQKGHLIGTDAAVSEDKPLGVIGLVGYGVQLQTRLFRGTVGLELVTAHTGGDHIGPGVLALARKWYDVVTCEFVFRKLMQAVQADSLVATEQLSIV